MQNPHDHWDMETGERYTHSHPPGEGDHRSLKEQRRDLLDTATTEPVE